jgi:hypothetical protein
MLDGGYTRRRHPTTSMPNPIRYLEKHGPLHCPNRVHVHFACDHPECEARRHVQPGTCDAGAIKKASRGFFSTKKYEMRALSLKEVIGLCAVAYDLADTVVVIDGHRWKINALQPRHIARHSQKLLNTILSLPDGLTCAAVLAEDDSKPKPVRVLAFKGTTTANDWTTNLRNHVTGTSSQHQAAIKLAKMTEDVDLLVGHSLGGGLAASAACATGIRAATINSATQSLVARVMTEHSGKAEHLDWATKGGGITNYVFQGDAIDARSGLPLVIPLVGLIINPLATVATAAALSHTHVGDVVVLEGASTGKHGADIHRLTHVVDGPYHQQYVPAAPGPLQRLLHRG